MPNNAVNSYAFPPSELPTNPLVTAGVECPLFWRIWLSPLSVLKNSAGYIHEMSYEGFLQIKALCSLAMKEKKWDQWIVLCFTICITTSSGTLTSIAHLDCCCLVGMQCSGDSINMLTGKVWFLIKSIFSVPPHGLPQKTIFAPLLVLHESHDISDPSVTGRPLSINSVMVISMGIG